MFPTGFSVQSQAFIPREGSKLQAMSICGWPCFPSSRRDETEGRGGSTSSPSQGRLEAQGRLMVLKGPFCLLLPVGGSKRLAEKTRLPNSLAWSIYMDALLPFPVLADRAIPEHFTGASKPQESHQGPLTQVRFPDAPWQVKKTAGSSRWTQLFSL